MKKFERSVVSLGNIGYMTEVFNKVKNEGKLNMVYLGGSITQGCHATVTENRYVDLSAQWWKNRFPQAEIEYFNAGIGATTSQFGAARAPIHVLDKKPDLVFVEFSVNDEADTFFMETYESLIRRLLKDENVKAVILINNLFYDSGRNAQDIHNGVGKHYQLPIVSVRDHIYPLLTDGTEEVSEYTEDMLHPKDKGHRLIADIIGELLDTEYELYEKSSKQAQKPKLPEALTRCRFEDAYIFNNLNCQPQTNGFEADTHTSDYFSDPFKNGWTASKKGDSITFEVTGSVLMIQWRRTINKPAPIASAVIDGNTDKKVILDANFEETWGDLCALTTLSDDLDKTRPHTLTITVEQEGEAGDFMLISVISADK
ncbi:MAG: SGNH/GDSL hydrolase family protein [Ruminococcus sp.]|nr:SGNH/GDSL hydrolase family protein [Ruminococcus sp.]